MAHSKEYVDHLQSEKWAEIRQNALDYANYACERCANAQAVLQVHHKTYRNLGNEKLSDLEVLCEPCHEIADAERKEETANRLYMRRFEGWARKVYGEGWEYFEDFETVQRHFHRWAEWKGITV